jgi:pimeloyl-ACP methyl ester carboxylesterase
MGSRDQLRPRLHRTAEPPFIRTDLTDYGYALRYRDENLLDAGDGLDVYARAFEAPGAMRALCEIYRELDHDAEIHSADIAANGKLTVPVLASGGGAQTLAANYVPMCEEVAVDVTGHLVPDAGHWVAEENPDYFCCMFIDFDTSARTRQPTQPNR